MSHEDSQSESSNSSPNAVYMLRSEKDLSAATGSSADLSVGKHVRSATVRRASSASFRTKQDSFAKSQDDLIMPPANMPTERYRRSLDSTYRQSLESISEYKTKNSFSTTSLGPMPYRELDSACSDCTDYATRSSVEAKDERRTNATSTLSYLSWIESVNSNFMNTPSKMHSASSSTMPNVDPVDVDSKVGEWNNFWLNYTNTTSRHTSSPYLAASTTCGEDRTGDDISDCKSTCSTQREFNEKMAMEQVAFTLEEVQEAMQCAQRIVDILQKALKRSDVDNFEIYIERSRQDSYYSQQTNSFNEESLRDRSFSYMWDQQELQKRNMMKTSQQQPPPPPQSTTSSCINALMNSGVGDILKRVINKRRELLTSDDGAPSTARSSFSDWSTGAK